jgi:hypothetical protein
MNQFMKNTFCHWTLAALVSTLSPALHAATCVVYPAGSALLDIAGRVLEVKAPRELEPCMGRLTQGRLIVVVRGADGLTQTREFREGALFDAAAIGVARPGKLITAVLTGDFVSRPGYSRGPLEHPESVGIPVGDILLPTTDLVIGPVKSLIVAGYDQLSIHRQGEASPLLLLALGGLENATVPKSLFRQDTHYGWRLKGSAGVQEGTFITVNAQRQKATTEAINSENISELAGQVKVIGLLMDAELTFDAIQHKRELSRAH